MVSLTERKIRKNKRNIIKKALNSFYEQGIECTKISEIAKKCGVGVVTVYRYFGTKAGLVIAATEFLWSKLSIEVDRYLNAQKHNQKTGIMQVNDCLQLYLSIYKKHRHYYRYLYEFNKFLGSEETPPLEHEMLQKKITFIKPYFLAAVDKGKSDGTISFNIDGIILCRSISNFISGVAQKVALFEKDGEKMNSTTVEFEMCIEMVLCFMRRNTDEKE